MLPPNIPSDSSQKKILKALKKIGFTIRSPLFGKGSHRLAECPKTGCSIIVQHKIYKEVIKSYCKRVDELGYDVDKFIKYL
ncbi:hypothetical protein ACFL2L_01265 [Patescibacteria group bacterium]